MRNQAFLRSPNLRIAAALLSACTLLLGGCGGEGDDPSPFAPAVEGRWQGELRLAANQCGGLVSPAPEAALAEVHMVTVSGDEVSVAGQSFGTLRGPLSSPTEFAASAERSGGLRGASHSVVYSNIKNGSADVTLLYSPINGPGGCSVSWQGRRARAKG
jgi:hypothetical protein